ncbi:MAG: ATP-binding protein [Pseudohongiellaceae bacterium]
MTGRGKPDLKSDLRVLEAIAGDTSLAVIVLDPDGLIVDWGRGAESFYGFGRSRACGSHFTELMPPESRGRFQRCLAHLVASGTTSNSPDCTLEGARLIDGGKHREVWSTATAVKDDAGAVQRVVVLEHDITETRQDRIRLDSYLDTSADAIVIVNRDGEIVRCNGEAENLTGYSHEELLHEVYEKLVPDAVRVAHRRNHLDFYDNAQSREMGSGLALSIRHRSGEEIPVQISLTPVTVAEETTVLVRIRDIRRELEINKSLARSRDEAERHLRAKSRFLAAASHDLRQPLQAINMYLGVLESQQDAEGRRDTINRIRRSADSINELLNGLLDLSRLESGAIVPQVGSFPVSEVLERVHNNAVTTAQQKGQSFTFMDCSAYVRTDKNLLEQLLMNLASNAIRYTDEGGRIVLGCRHQRDAIEIRVVDNGIGIAEEHIGSIFEEYVRISGSDRGVQGAGLGLAIVRQITELLGLQIRVRSQVGRGTEFSLVVPRIPRARHKRRRAEGVAATRPVVAGATVLMLEDNAAVLDSTVQFLESRKFRVLAASDTARAYAYLADGAVTPDLIISDYSLDNGENGLEAIKGMRSRLRRSVPAILISGHTSTQLRHEAKLENCHLIHKPLEPQALLAAIEALLRQPAQPDDNAE